MKPNQRLRKRKGYVLVLTAMSMLFLVPIVGLAVDVTLIYLIKARLSAAVDAAALASARALSRGILLSDQSDSARDTAQRYFEWNFGSGHLLTDASSLQTEVAVSESEYKLRRVTVDAHVQAPVFFLRLLGREGIRVNASGQASRRDVNIVLVLDRSSSMAGQPCVDLTAAATAFVDKFAEGRDNVGLITFARTSAINFPAASNFKSASPNVNQIVGAIICDSTTTTAAALSNAYGEIKRINQPGALNLVLLVTDGSPTAMQMVYPIKRLPPDPSTCAATVGSKRTGVLSAGSGFANGIFARIPQIFPPGEDKKLVLSTGCAFATNQTLAYRDVAYIPELDEFQNSVTGYHGALAAIPSGPYEGHYEVSESNLALAARNATDNIAHAMRYDTAFQPVIFAVGLDVRPQDDELLARVANAKNPANSSLDLSIPSGLYLKAPTSADLDSAFNLVASEILRLSM